MKYPVYNQKAEKVKEVELNPDIFGVKINEGLVHQAAIAQTSNSRKVLAHTKDRSEVRGGGKKPWRQKGTGRARAGSNRSPLWKGGGVTFGPSKDRNFSQKINKKMKRKALFMCLTDRVNDKNLFLIDDLKLEKSKTKEVNGLLNRFINKNSISKAKDLKSDDKKSAYKSKSEKVSALIIGAKNISDLSRSGRNISGVKVLGADSLNILDILKYKYLLIDESGLDIVEKTYFKK